MSQVDRVFNGCPLDALRALKEAGKIGFIANKTEEPWPVLPFLAHGEFDVFQIAWNFIYHAAARLFLVEAVTMNARVVAMRTITSGARAATSGVRLRRIDAADMEYPFGDIETDDGNLLNGRLLFSSVSQ